MVAHSRDVATTLACLHRHNASGSSGLRWVSGGALKEAQRPGGFILKKPACPAKVMDLVTNSECFLGHSKDPPRAHRS